MKTLMDLLGDSNLTLKEVGQFTGLSESYCSLLLNGKRRLSLENAEKFSRLFNKTLDEIFLLYDFSKRKELHSA